MSVGRMLMSVPSKPLSLSVNIPLSLYNARPTVTFPAAGHCLCSLVDSLLTSRPAEVGGWVGLGDR